MRIAILIFVLLFSATVYAADYTVKTADGDYSNIITCMNAISAGDRCVVYAGTFPGGNITTSGTSGNRKTLIAADGVDPVISSTINVTNESYITISNFTFDGIGGDSPLLGSGCSFITLSGNMVNNTQIGVGANTSGLLGDDILLEGNYFLSDRGNDVFKPFGDRWVIRNNVAANINDSLDEHIDFVQTACSQADPIDFLLVENNWYYNISGANVHFFLINCSAGLRTNFILRFNRVKEIGTSGATVFDDSAGGSGFTGVSVYNNVFAMESESARNIGHIDLAVSGTGIFYNNILYEAFSRTEGQGLSTTSSIPVDGTLAYSPNGTINFWDPLDSCTNCVKNDNPDFTDYSNRDFSLQADSPAIDNGVHLTTVATADTGSGTSLIVDNPYPFQDGWAGVDPDVLLVGATVDTAAEATISSIDYDTDTITLTDGISRNDGDKVWLYKDSEGTVVIYGDDPDIGAEEFGSEEAATGSTGGFGPGVGMH